MDFVDKVQIPWVLIFVGIGFFFYFLNKISSTLQSIFYALMTMQRNQDSIIQTSGYILATLHSIDSNARDLNVEISKLSRVLNENSRGIDGDDWHIIKR